jgi:sterol desaturase/sphingolipid hydroxylase (fatty acid hydroxylase superfamily)
MFKTANKLIQKAFDFRAAPLLAVTAIALFIFETKYALRKRKISRWERIKTNSVIAATAAMGLRLALMPGIVMASQFAERKKLGLLRLMPLPTWLTGVLAFMALDYSNYRWHRLNHEWHFLWRLHQVHHADLDLDLSTALRFHVGEVLLSVIYRGAWVAGIGASPGIALLYEFFFEASNNFQHSNLSLPEQTDRRLTNFIVTPRMHGIHHSIVREETDSNFSIVLTLWDRLHHTLHLDVPQEIINIGIPYVREHLPAKRLFTMPLEGSAAWQLPDGSVPAR